MKAPTALAVVLVLAIPAGAHRLDEYLQATRVGIQMEGIDLSIDLTPGVAVAQQLLRLIDLDGNGRISREEELQYAERVLRDVQLKLDGKLVPLKPVTATFPPRADMEQGEGVIHLKAFAKISKLSLGSHEIAYRNEHLPDISVYLVNGLVPANKAIQITGQLRDEQQKDYRLRFEVK
jgi:hypothetical protein